MAEKIQYYSKQISIYSIIWTLAFGLFVLFRSYGIGEGEIKEWVEDPISSYGKLFLIISMGVFLGISTAISDALIGKQLERNQPYGTVILLKSGFYLLSIVIMIGCIHAIFYIPGVYRGEVPTLMALYLSKPAQMVALYAVLITLLISFVNMVNDKFGPGNLLKLLFGYYHQPKSEERIIMFIDLKSSTVAAERIGDMKYSGMIQQCFRDITESVMKFDASIYQYVGDEVILVWSKEDGLKNHNCLYVYFHFRDLLEKKSAEYMDRFGWKPEFKAGAHLGNTITTEVGFIKKDIAYHGDVLNTTARIQGMCNLLGEQLLISEDLERKFNGTVASLFDSTKYQDVDLKGKNNSMNISGIMPIAK